ncbi:MAG: hypothetical protein J6T73_05385, partial [Clostridia bacterium]|nr:hypothetical protein [Clostridia bacterium]
GWALIDYYNIPKASYYAFKRNASSVTCSVVEAKKYRLYAANDSLDGKDVSIKAYLLSLKDKEIIDTFETKIHSKPYCADYIELPWTPDDLQFVIGDIEYEGIKDRCFYKRKNLELKNCNTLLKVEKSGKSVRMSVDGYVHVVELDGDYIFSDNYFTMLPGEIRTITLEECENAMNKEITVCGYTL